MAHTLAGTPLFPEADVGPMAATPPDALDRKASRLADHAGGWVKAPLSRRLELIRESVEGVAAVADRWVRAATDAKGMDFNHPNSGEEWHSGPAVTLRMLRLLQNSLLDILVADRPRLTGAPFMDARGRARVEVFPADTWDRLVYMGIDATVRFQDGTAPEDVLAQQARAYRTSPDPGVVLVLGAGNISSIPATDMLTKLFVDLRVVLLKMNPVNDYLGPLFEEAFRGLIDEGVLEIVYGGRDVGARLIESEHVTEVHLTGSDKTHDAIVFGSGPDGAARKAAGTPLMTKPVTAELGNVTPVIVVPGPWTRSDLEYQAENLASMLTNNAGYNCIATRVITTHAGWGQRRDLLDALGAFLDRTPTRHAYYPGAKERHQQFVDAHPGAHQFGIAGADDLPWTVIEAVDPDDPDNICFRTEAFASIKAEVALPGDSIAEYLDRAVEFCNENLWGTLGASILVHPRSMRDQTVANAVERAIANLRYGTVAVNLWSAAGYALMSTPWGAYPGHLSSDIQSGIGTVHNALMLEQTEKAIVKGPWRSYPKPVWFPTHRTASETLKALTSFEVRPSVRSLAPMIASAIRG